MKLPFTKPKKQGIGVVIVTGACCIPGMAPFDAEAERIVKQAAAETGVEIQFKAVPVLLAMQGGLGKNVLQEGLTRFQESDKLPLPAVLINGKTIEYGVPNLDLVKSALIDAKNQITDNIQDQIRPS